MTSRFFRSARNTAGILGGITIGSLVLIPDAVERLTRTTRVLSTCGSVAADDYLSRKLKSFRDEKFSPEDQLQLDTRNAKKFLRLAEKNGFLFCKLGQYAAAHPQVPPSYKLVLKTLQDKAPPHTWEDVETVLREEFPGTLESKFAAIERQPIASASIAQVHRGWLLDGTQVAVKVQHRELKRMARSDVAALDSVFLALHYFYKDLEYLRDAWVRWRVTLLDELDFKREAENGERVRAHFQHDPRFHVPLIHSGSSTHRVLTQEWIHGETLRDLIDKATVVAVDPAAPPPPTSFTTGSEGSSSKHPPLLVAPFAKYGVVNPSDVGRATCDFFAEQLLLHGFVHCDPHPANVMLRRRPPSASQATTLPEWQLCIIDWGMVRQLDVPFRASFCDLWFHLLTQNKEGAMQATRGMGMLEEDTEALSYFLTFRGVGRGSGKLGAPKTKEEWKAVRKQYEWVTASDVNAFALRLPSDFSFVMRTISLARGLNEVLGGSNRDRFASFGSAAAAGRRVSERGGGKENMGGGGGAVRDTLTPPTLASSLWTAFQAVAVEEEVGVNPLAPRVLTDSERQESKSWWEKQGRGLRKWVDDWVMACLLVLIDLRETWGANK